MPAPSFEDFVNARSRSLLRTAYALTGDKYRAEDLLQTTLAKCYGRWDRIDNHEAYVRRVLASTSTAWRHRRWHGEVSTLILPDIPTASDLASVVDSRDAILRGLTRLPARQRAVVALRYFDDLSDEQIAEALKISTGTVRSQAARALATLRDVTNWTDWVEDSA